MLKLRSGFRAAVVLFGLFAAGFSFAGESLSVEESVTLAASPDKVWKVVGNYGQLESWHPVVAKTTISKGKNNQVGAHRLIETKDGGKIVEALLAYDAAKMSMRYRFVDAPLPLSDYRSKLSVVASGKGSKVVWSGSFKANGVEDAKAREIVSGIYRAGLDQLGKQFGS